MPARVMPKLLRGGAPAPWYPAPSLQPGGRGLVHPATWSLHTHTGEITVFKKTNFYLEFSNFQHLEKTKKQGYLDSLIHLLSYDCVFTQVQEQIEDLLVVPGDFVALQHDAGTSGLLECSPDPSSPWKQSILVQNRSDWLDSNETLELIGDGKWVHEFICPIRMLYVGQNETKLRSPFLKAGLPQMGDYSLEVTSIDLDFPVTASCSIHIIPPLSLTLVYPTNRNGTVYFLPNRTSVLVMARSEHSAVFGWQGSNKTVPFQSFCPQELESKVVECKTFKSNNDTLFAWLDLELGSTPGQTKVVLHAQSEVTQADLEIQARVEEPLRGLQIQPHPAHRVLMETVVVSTLLISSELFRSMKKIRTSGMKKTSGMLMFSKVSLIVFSSSRLSSSLEQMLFALSFYSSVIITFDISVLVVSFMSLTICSLSALPFASCLAT